MATRRKPPAAAWKPGQSGNPKGRPAGTGEVAKLRAAIADRVPELLAAMMARALDGDVGASRLLLAMSKRIADHLRETNRKLMTFAQVSKALQQELDAAHGVNKRLPDQLAAQAGKPTPAG